MEIKEIIDDLRVCADRDILCSACPRYEKFPLAGSSACFGGLMQEAADVIESQQKRIAELESAFREQEERERPKPLTLDELKKMGGEPYYHVSLQGGENHWAILDQFIAKHIEDYHYGEYWLAYRSKPKEDA